MDFNNLIENTDSHNLKELHQLIFKKSLQDKNIKANLKRFLGFEEKDFDCHMNYAVENFDAEELAEICKQLQIVPLEVPAEDAKLIVRKLTRNEDAYLRSAASTNPVPVSSGETINSRSTVQSSPTTQSCTAIQNQSKILHELKKQLLDLEERQMDIDESSEEFSKVNKKILFTQKKIDLEENRRAELLEEHSIITNRIITPSSSTMTFDENIQSLLLKTPQNLKLNDFDGSSCLEWHYFLLQYNTSTEKYNLSNGENLMRLNDYIKGEARQKVDLLLKSSENPAHVINILDNEYGGNDRIVKEIIKRIHDIKKVNSLENFKQFNCTLQNISSVVFQLKDDSIKTQKLQSILLDKLPEHFISQWANYMISKDLRPKTTPFDVFTKWINYMAEIVSEVSFNSAIRDMDRNFEKNVDKSIHKNSQPSNNSFSHPPGNSRNSGRDSEEKSKTSVNSNKLCKLCKKEEHSLSLCSDFKALDVNKRFTTVKKMNACIFCLNKHFGFCRKRKICDIDGCTKYHHELLHQTEKSNNVPANCTVLTKSTVLLKTLPVKLKINNKISNVIAFLDDGSMLSLIDKAIAEKLNLNGVKEPISFQWTGDIYKEDLESQNVSFEICGENSEHFHEIKNIHTVKNLKLPHQRINFRDLLEKYPELKNMNISESYEGVPVLLIGQDHANLITNRQTIDIPNNGPLVSKTRLGWAVHGPVNIKGENFGSMVCCMAHTETLEEMVNNQFKLENFDVNEDKNEVENSKVVEFAEKTLKKVDGHYEVCLPWKENVTTLPDSLPLAKQRLLHLERTLLKDNKLKNSYKSQMEKLFKTGYARKINFADLKKVQRYWILPHFPVVNPKKPQKPPRIVFDAAAKVEKQSLNDFLHPGPDWLCSILGILIRFRKHQVAFTGDICEMFNRVKIQEDDTFAQCFLWRDLNTKLPIQIYQMKAMLFGLNCAPFLAQFVKNFNAVEYKNEYPDAYEAITKNHYMDDFVDSKDDLNEAVKLINEVIKVHRFGDFNIRSFISNNRELIQNIPKESVAEDMFNENPKDIHKVLGLFWNTITDNFHFLYEFYKINPEIMNNGKVPTKREVLQTLMTIFDPLGFLTPITIKGKILLQLAWKSKIPWDATIPTDLHKKWLIWMKEIEHLKILTIPRCYKINNLNPENVQLHILCDASASAYCAVAYLRTREKSSIELSLVYSKSRVAPIQKSLTIPKLELMGAVLAVRIAELLKENLQVTSLHFWTDSMVILAWIKSKKYLKVFEKNRVDEILKYSKPSDWEWIPTKENIADLGTRDHPKDLSNNSMWIAGPEFLRTDTFSWENFFKMPGDQIEVITSTNVCMFISNNDHMRKKLVLPDVSNFNSYYHLLKVTAWTLRYIRNLKAKVNQLPTNTKSYIGLFELKAVKKLWIKRVQHECFKQDIDKMLGITNGSNTRLSKYNLQLDDQNILRLQGRIRYNAFLDQDMIDPIVLDGKHKFTKLLILEIHDMLQHYSLQAVIHEFKSQYWMPKITSSIKSIVKHCFQCNSRNPQPVIQPIGSLIPDRLRFFEKTFTVSGIDYFGPFYVKNNKTISQRYGVLFTCLTTRATHIEIAYTLNTDSCVMAVRRMMSRRGKIQKIISDNAKNFKGASKELIKSLKEVDNEEIEQRLVKFGINWEFIPVRTPHFGGCWERMIGCFKRAISAVIPENRYLNDEMLHTVFVETEYILNSRPYILESDEPHDPSSLTPNDVLIPKFIEIDEVSPSTSVGKRKWRVCEALMDSFWNRFIKEYVPTILNSKLRKYTKNVQINIGDLVYVKNQVSRGKWPIGKIENIYPGRDGKTRVVDVQFNGKTENTSVHHLMKINLDNSI